MILKIEDSMTSPDVEAAPLVSQPLYAQIRDRLLNRIVKSEWVPGEAIPNEFKLASQYRVSIGTVRRAVTDLEDRGVVKRVHGRGTFVAGKGPNAFLARFERLALPDGQPFNPHVQLESIEKQSAPDDVRAALDLKADEPVYCITQQLHHGERKIGAWNSYVVAARLPGLQKQLRFGQQLYSLLADYGLLVARTEDVIGAELAGPVYARLLDISPTEIVLVGRRTAFGLNDEPVEFRRSVFKPGEVNLVHLST